MRMGILVVLVALAGLIAAAAPWRSCGTAKDHAKIVKLTVVPEVFRPGVEFTLIMAAILVRPPVLRAFCATCCGRL